MPVHLLDSGGRKKSGGLSEIKNKFNNVLKCYVYGETREEFNNFLEKVI